MTPTDARRARRPAPWAAGAVAALLLPLVLRAPLGAQPEVRPVSAPSAAVATAAAQGPADGARAPVPWRVGERLQYEVRFGRIRVGQGSIEVVQTESIRGREAYHTRFRVAGGTFFYRVNDVLESWIDTRTLHSLRFAKDQEEGGTDRETSFEIYPDRRVYQEIGDVERPSVAAPLDDGSFLYFIRTLPLEVGKTYEFDRYFKPDRNPVRIRVLRREQVKVPAGTFDAIVVQPSFRTKGIFSEGGKAEVWLSNDDRRIVLQMKSSLSFGSLNLYLKSAN